MTIKLSIVTTFLMLIFGGLFVVQPVLSQNTHGFGVSPGIVNVDYIKPGSNFEQEVFFVRTDSSKDAEILVDKSTTELANWISIEPGDIIHFPKGKTKIKATIKFNIPSTIKLGDYDGYINAILQVDPPIEGGQVATQPGVHIKLGANVTNQTVKKLEVRNSVIKDIYVGEDLNLDLLIKNSGNETDAPTKVNIVVLDGTQKELINLSEENISSVPAFQTKEVVINFGDPKLHPGSYIAKITAYEDSNSVLYESDINFNVLELTNESDDLSISANSIIYLIGCIGSLLIILVAIFIILKKRKKSDR